MDMKYLQRPEEGTRSPGTGITDACASPGVCFDLNPGPLEEQPGFFTAESYLYSITHF